MYLAPKKICFIRVSWVPDPKKEPTFCNKDRHTFLLYHYAPERIALNATIVKIPHIIGFRYAEEDSPKYRNAVYEQCCQCWYGKH